MTIPNCWVRRDFDPYEALHAEQAENAKLRAALRTLVSDYEWVVSADRVRVSVPVAHFEQARAALGDE